MFISLDNLKIAICKKSMMIIKYMNKNKIITYLLSNY